MITLAQKIEKIQGLFAKGNSTNFDAEAQTCMLKAQELMVKWGIDKSQVEEQEEEEVEVVWEHLTEAGGLKVNWKMSLAKTIAANFRCEFFMGKKCGNARYGVFFGVKEDTQVAKELFLKMLKVVRKGQDRVNDYLYNRGLPVEGVRGDYAIGFVNGLRKAFENQVEEKGWGLVVCTPPEVKEAYSNLVFDKNPYLSQQAKAAGNDWAYGEGQKDGEKQVPSEKKKQLQG